MYTPYRRIVQAALFAAMFLIPVLNAHEIYAVTGTFYAISVGNLGVADPSVILQAIFASGEITKPLLAAAVFPLILALLFGRVWCGWMCPYHVLADFSAWLRRRFLRRDKVDSVPLAGSFRANSVRFGFLAFGTAAAGVAGIPVLNYVNAPGILSTEAMIFVKEHSVSIECGFIAGLFLLELVVLPRFWCRLFCPTGSVVSLFRTSYTLRVSIGAKSPKSPCCTDNTCSAACPMGLEPFREGGNLLCTNCARCVDACGSGRLRFTGFHQV